MVTRRGFLGIMVGAAVAPAVVKAENLMKIFVPKKEIFVPRYPDEFGLRGLAADYDGDAMALYMHDHMCKTLGISPEMLHGSGWSSAFVANTVAQQNKLIEESTMFVARYPITGIESLRPVSPRVEALVANDFKRYW